MLSSHGTLAVRAETAGAVALENVSVRISGAGEENRFISYSLLTDVDGVTPDVELPAPPVELSLSPHPKDAPYATYDIVLEREGFYTRRIYGVAVFAGIKTLQIVNMIPTTNEALVDLPRGNINVFIPRNYDLE